MVNLCYHLCQGCLQCSILAFYLRIGLAEIGGRRMRRTIYALMGFSILNNTIAVSLLMTFSMVESFVLQSQKYLTPLWFTYGTLNLLMDLIIWSIPLPTVILVMRNLSTRKRILLVLVFTSGIMCWCSSILRISLRKYIMNMGGDPTYNAPICYLLYVTEVSVAISCVSAATLRPLVIKATKGFNRLRGKPTSTNQSRSTGYQFGASPGLAQSKGDGSKTGGSRSTGNTREFGEQTTPGEELAEWKDNSFNTTISQFVQEIRGCPHGDGDLELGSVVAHTSSSPRCPDLAQDTELQVPAPTAVSTIHRLSSSSSGETLRTTNIGSAIHGVHSQPPCDAIPSSESTVNLMSTNSNSTIHYSRPLI